jgi:hypothetical protein
MKKRRATILVLKIDGVQPSLSATASSNELLRDGLMPIFGRAVERLGQEWVHPFLA